jgi:hypothetical protein
MFSLFPDGIPVILKGLVDNPLSRCEESPYSSVPILVLVPDPVLVLSLLWCCPRRSGPYFGCLLCCLVCCFIAWDASVCGYPSEVHLYS